MYALPSSGNASQIDSKNWSKHIESIILWFERYLGVDGIPLSHLIRVHDVVIQKNGDPRKGEANSIYITHQYEMIARTLYFVDNDSAPLY